MIRFERSLQFLNPHRVVLAGAEILLDDFRDIVGVGAVGGRRGRWSSGRHVVQRIVIELVHEAS